MASWWPRPNCPGGETSAVKDSPIYMILHVQTHHHHISPSKCMNTAGVNETHCDARMHMAWQPGFTVRNQSVKRVDVPYRQELIARLFIALLCSVHYWYCMPHLQSLLTAPLDSAIVCLLGRRRRDPDGLPAGGRDTAYIASDPTRNVYYIL